METETDEIRKDEERSAADTPSASPYTGAEQPVPDIAEIERAAEQRGYLRGRNERIEELMGAPGMWQPLQSARRDDDDDEEDAPTPILRDMRRSVWEV